MKYTLYQVLKKGLALQRNGKPYKYMTSLALRVRQMGFKTIRQKNGKSIYQLSEKDLKKINTWK